MSDKAKRAMCPVELDLNNAIQKVYLLSHYDELSSVDKYRLSMATGYLNAAQRHVTLVCDEHDNTDLEPLGNRDTNQVERTAGYYWVFLYGSWGIAYYSDTKDWYMINSNEKYTDSDFEDIDEEMIVQGLSADKLFSTHKS